MADHRNLYFLISTLYCQMPPNIHSNKLKDPNKIYPAFILFQFLLQKCEVEKSSKQFRAVFKWFHGRVASQVMIYIIITPGIVNRTFENRTQSNTRLSVSSISEQIEFNRTNRTQSIWLCFIELGLKWIVFDWLYLYKASPKQAHQSRFFKFIQ